MVAKLLFVEQHSDRARALFRNAGRGRDHLVAPTLLAYEISSVIRKRMRRDRVPLSTAIQLFARFEALPIIPLAPPGMHRQALQLAESLGIAVFDAHYVALSQSLSCDLWVADEALLRGLQGRLPSVRWIGAYP